MVGTEGGNNQGNEQYDQLEEERDRRIVIQCCMQHIECSAGLFSNASCDLALDGNLSVRCSRPDVRRLAAPFILMLRRDEKREKI
jgi:hypothetical protein